MGILDIFQKKKAENPDEEFEKEGAAMKSSEEKYEEDVKAQDASSQSLAPTKSVVELERDVELLKVQMEVMKQSKLAAEERFARINEQVGEIRSSVLESERDAKQIQVEAEKSVELISSVQPEKLMIEVKRLEARIEEQKGLQEKFAALQGNLSTELQEMRSRMEVIRGSETMMKLNDDVKRELSDVKKIELNAERDADKVEAIFVELQKRFNEYQILYEQVKEINNSFKDMAREFSTIKIKLESSAKKSDFEDLQKRVNEKVMAADETLSSLEKAYVEFKEAMSVSLSRLNEEFGSKADALGKSILEIESKKTELNTMFEETRRQVSEMRDELLSKISDSETLSKNAEKASRDRYENTAIELEMALKKTDEKLKDSKNEMKLLSKEMDKRFDAVNNALHVKEAVMDDALKTESKAIYKSVSSVAKQIMKLDNQMALFGRRISSFENRVKHIDKLLSKSLQAQKKKEKTAPIATETPEIKSA